MNDWSSFLLGDDVRFPNGIMIKVICKMVSRAVFRRMAKIKKKKKIDAKQ